LQDGDGGATRPVPRNRGAEEFRGYPTVGPRHAPSSRPDIKYVRSSAKDGASERLGCRI